MTTSEPTPQQTALNPKEYLVFDHYTLRKIVGFIAFLFPLVVTFLARTITSSISASYHTNARDVFVGCLCVIGILLIGYKGHKPDLPPEKVGRFWNRVGGFLNLVSKLWKGKRKFQVEGRKHEEDLVSTIGGFAAIVTALCPTACDFCKTDTKSIIHYVAAIILFSTVVYFCVVAFLRSVNGKWEKGDGVFTFLRAVKEALTKDSAKDTLRVNGKKILRGYIYVSCGSLIALIMLGLFAAQFTVPEATRIAFHITFWAEAVALCLFGIAWLTAFQFPFLLDDNEKHQAKASK